MKILLITNLYPPQELGGYGRAMSDFAWGMKELDHQVEVITSNAEYLGDYPKKQEANIYRDLILKGSFKNGVSHILDPIKRNQIDNHNIQVLNNLLNKRSWDGILLGNIDLIGHEILPELIRSKLPVLHHIGFVNPPFESIYVPIEKNYIVLSASHAVKESLRKEYFIKEDSLVVYPGARVELFGEEFTKRKLPQLPDGTANNPLSIAYAGLLMSSKGLHTLVEALIKLKLRGLYARAYIAGADFQPGYKSALLEKLKKYDLLDSVAFTGSLNREKLARLLILNHVFVFPSVYPEAFGIVQAEAMASGLALVTTGVGGSKELLESGVNGFLFESQNSDDLCNKLMLLTNNPSLIENFGQNGKKIVLEKFNTINSAKELIRIIRNFSKD